MNIKTCGSCGLVRASGLVLVLTRISPVALSKPLKMAWMTGNLHRHEKLVCCLGGNRTASCIDQCCSIDKLSKLLYKHYYSFPIYERKVK